MRASYLHHLYQKHYARRCDALSTYLDAKIMRTLKRETFLLIAIPAFPILLVSSIIGIHYLGYLISIPLISLGIIAVAFIIGACTYTYNYGSPLDTHRADRLTKLLQQHGPMHTIMLLNQYQQTTHDYMDSNDLQLLLTEPHNRKRFTTTGNITHLPGQKPRQHRTHPRQRRLHNRLPHPLPSPPSNPTTPRTPPRPHLPHRRRIQRTVKPYR